MRTSIRMNGLFSIRGTIIVLFFMVIVTPFLFFSYYSSQKSIESISEANAAFSMDSLYQKGKIFEDYLVNINFRMNDIIASDEFQSLFANVSSDAEGEMEFTAKLNRLIDEQKQINEVHNIRIYPINPEAYPAYMNSLDGGDEVISEPWFVDVRVNGMPSWRLFLPKDNVRLFPTPVISRTKRFSGLDHEKPMGVFAFDLTLDEIGRMVESPKRMHQQETILLDERGEVLFHPRSRLIGDRHPSAELLQYLDGKNEGTQTMSINGQESLVAFVKMNRIPWTLVNVIPLSVLTEPIEKINNLTYIFVGIYILCCFIVISYITLYFTNPIVKLVRSMRKLQSGNLQTSNLISRRKDEIGLLYRGFESMVNRIQALIREVYESEKTKKELEFQVLSHQINPHFLYNTLDSIRWKAENQHMTEISRMVESLGNLLRLSLNQGNELTTVKREIEQVNAYIQIEKARMGKSLKIVFLVDDDIMQMPFLRLLLQPLVENAIHHGIGNNPERGKIVLTGKSDNNDILLELSDNGAGIPPHVLEELDSHDQSGLPNHRHGVGLYNVNARLKLYFGEAYKLDIRCKPGEGTRITIRHPILLPDDKRFS